MSKTIAFLVTSLVLLAAVPVLTGGAQAQSDNDVVLRDGSGDVVVVTPVEELHSVQEPTQVPLVDGFKPADFTEVRVYGETATEFWIGFTVADFSKPGVYPNQVAYVICFQWDGTGTWYRLWVKFDYPVGAASVEPQVDRGSVTFTELPDASHCNIRTFVGSDSLGAMSFTVLDPIVDLDKNTYDIRIPRLAMENMGPPSEPLRPVPKAGETLTGFVARSTFKTGSEVYHAFDEVVSSGEKLTFASDTGNSELRVTVLENVRGVSAGVESRGGVPLYGVEIGDFQTVPLTIENHLAEALEVQLTATVAEAADPKSWQTRIIPAISLPAATADGPSVEAVTLIVDTAPSIQHKDRARVVITATDERFPGLLGAGQVDVLGVRPPTPSASTVYFHTTGRTCNTADHWINTLKEDAKAPTQEVILDSCDVAGGGGVFEATRVGLTFRPDVPFARDYRLSVADTAKGVVYLKAVRKVPGQPMEVPTGMIADINVALYSGGAVIGEANIHSQQLGGSPTPVAFEIPIEAPILGAQSREVPNDRPLAIRVSIVKQQRTYVVCEKSVCGFEDERTVPDPSTLAGSVFFVTAGSEVTLPILDSQRAGDLINITASGALISLRLAGLEPERDRTTNPGKSVVFNVTVRNEGVNRDTADLEVRVNQTGWIAEILPTKTLDLAIGEANNFNVRVTAPDTAREGASARFTIHATSRVDPEATASLPVRVAVTLGHIFENEKGTFEAPPEVQDSPAPGALLVFGLTALAVAALRSRRREA